MDTFIFKAYDIRGVYPEQINPKITFGISQSLASFFGGGKIIVARDGRVGSLELYRAAIKGFKIHDSRIKLVEVGLATTPMFYFLVQRLGARGGIMITASHNPKEYNGLKVVGRNAEMISGKEVLKIINSKS